MKAEDVQAQWKQIKGSLKHRWERFTDEDVKELKGKTDELVRKVQERYGLLKDDAERQVEDWIAKLMADLALAIAPARNKSARKRSARAGKKGARVAKGGRRAVRGRKPKAKRAGASRRKTSKSKTRKTPRKAAARRVKQR